eukprot:gene3797-5892_t
MIVCVVRGKAPAHACGGVRPDLLGVGGKVAVRWTVGASQKGKSVEAACGDIPAVTARLAELRQVATIDSGVRRLASGKYVSDAVKAAHEEKRRKWEQLVASMPERTDEARRRSANMVSQQRKAAERRKGERWRAAVAQQPGAARRRLRERSLHALQLNAQGLTSVKRAELNELLQRERPHVVALQETMWCEGADTPRFPGYAVHRVDGPAREGGQGGSTGGVALLVADEVRWQPFPQDQLPDAETAEVAGITVYPGGGAQPEVILSIYIPRAARHALDLAWAPAGAHLLGDFNIHSREWDPFVTDATISKDAPAAGRLLDWVGATGATILNDGRATRVGQKAGRGGAAQSAPDLAIAAAGHEAWWGRLHDVGSDHMAIATHLTVGGPVAAPPRRQPRWSFAKADWPRFTARLERELAPLGGREGGGGQTVQELSDAVEGAIIGAARAHVPRGTRAGKRAWFWWCPEAEAAVRRRKAARKQAERTRQPADVRAWKAEERRCKWEIHWLKGEAWRGFCSGLDHRSDSRRVWAVMGALAGKGARLRTMPVLREPGRRPGEPERVLTSDAEKAEAFARGYADASRGAAAAAPPAPHTPTPPAAAGDGRGSARRAAARGAQRPAPAAAGAQQPAEESDTDTVKLLGLWLDSDLSFRTHIGKVADRMERRLPALRRASGSAWGAMRGTLRSTSGSCIGETAGGGAGERTSERAGQHTSRHACEQTIERASEQARGEQASGASRRAGVRANERASGRASMT